MATRPDTDFRHMKQKPSPIEQICGKGTLILLDSQTDNSIEI